MNNLREIQALRRPPHGNIIKLLEVLYDQPTGQLALVFELMDMNIYELIRGRRHYVAEDRIKTYVYQLVKSMTTCPATASSTATSNPRTSSSWTTA